MSEYTEHVHPYSAAIGQQPPSPTVDGVSRDENGAVIDNEFLAGFLPLMLTGSVAAVDKTVTWSVVDIETGGSIFAEVTFDPTTKHTEAVEKLVDWFRGYVLSATDFMKTENLGILDVEVGDKVRSKSEPSLGTMKVVYVEPDEDVREGCSAIVTVETSNGLDDADMNDLELAKET